MAARFSQFQDSLDKITNNTARATRQMSGAFNSVRAAIVGLTGGVGIASIGRQMLEAATEGVPAFPQLGAAGGSILNVPAVTSAGCVRTGSPSERIFALVDGAQVIAADNGAVEISASRLASLQMDSAPTMDGTGATTAPSTTSMFQTSSTAIKVIRWVNFQRVADSAVAWLTVGA